MDTEENNNLGTMRFLFICGCSMSGVGKGTTISSIGNLLVEHGNVVTAIKIDPYLNVDAGLMSPAEHGEVYVLEDGAEVDLDLGNYERALDSTFTKNHNITSGKIFLSILNDEREGLYLGKTIQMVPHVTDRIKQWIKNTAYAYRNKDGLRANICLIEIGGTVGDLESGIFFEAIRQLINESPQNTCAIIVLTYVPMIGNLKEAKTKPTQHGIKDLKSLGLFPNFIVCRSEYPMNSDSLHKIASHANISANNIGNIYNVKNLYEIPLILNKQGIDKQILEYFKLPLKTSPFERLNSIYQVYEKIQTSPKSIKIVMVGKYMLGTDAYYSVIKAIEHSSLVCGVKVDLRQIEVTFFDLFDTIDEKILLIEDDFKQLHPTLGTTIEGFKLKQMYNDIISADGIIFPGGFGKRGIESLIKVCRIVRENKIPFLGICLGMQIAVIEYCRNVLGIKDANSLEFLEDSQAKDFKNDVITIMEDTNYLSLGGTLRLGSKSAYINKDSLTFKIYGNEVVQERHRHRYEVNNKFVPDLEKAGMVFPGKNKEGDRMDMMELSQDVHPFYFSTQSHPEFNNSHYNPSLPFYAFMLHASKQQTKFEEYYKAKASYQTNLIPQSNDQIGKPVNFDANYFQEELKKIEKCESKTYSSNDLSSKEVIN